MIFDELPTFRIKYQYVDKKIISLKRFLANFQVSNTQNSYTRYTSLVYNSKYKTFQLNHVYGINIIVMYNRKKNTFNKTLIK